MLKVHVQSKVRKKSNTHCYWLLSFVLGVEQYSDCKIELPLRFPPLAYQLNLQSIIHRNHYLLLSISTKMEPITQHLITLCIIEESLDMICPVLLFTSPACTSSTGCSFGSSTTCPTLSTVKHKMWKSKIKN